MCSYCLASRHTNCGCYERHSCCIDRDLKSRNHYDETVQPIETWIELDDLDETQDPAIDDEEKNVPKAYPPHKGESKISAVDSTLHF